MKKTDIDALAELPLAEIEERIANASERVETRVQRAQGENRDFTSREADLTADDRTELGALRDALQLRRRNAEQSEKVNRAVAEAVETRSAPWQPTLLVSEANLHAAAEALHAGHSYGATELVETRARMTTAGDLGSAGAWAPGAPNDPRHLIAFAGIPVSQLTGRTAQVPKYTGPTAAAGVDETTDHGEYDTVEPVNLTALRYGRWSDVSALANVVDDLIGLNRMHAWAIARDLDLMAVAAVEDAAASAGVSADLEQRVREAILSVAAETYSAETDLVVFGQPVDLAELTGTTPTNADDLGSYAVRFAGARTYPTTAATAGTLTVFAPAGFACFQAPLQSATLIDPADGSNKFGQWLHSTGVANQIVGAAATVGVS
ncbi:hypothetical protein A5698_06440 [Mycobacterium sp. E136]|uniref:hypothetical protein n=1 Tax=Mycobacterium sp. E136 TaxID=1834125 RepID=UPI0007FC1135|nr:hypothetical protein [Mycobacterium sp. E136]OBG83612.1 hypothetical protein A5698_06440 [Mycobacterium sp. E136]